MVLNLSTNETLGIKGKRKFEAEVNIIEIQIERKFIFILSQISRAVERKPGRGTYWIWFPLITNCWRNKLANNYFKAAVRPEYFGPERSSPRSPTSFGHC